MARAMHNCPSCGEAFASSQEVAAHWVTNHDRGLVPPGERMKRATTCWSCASEIPAKQAACACGWQHKTFN
jgi:predicted RNA-binding Zn-ribbon protein involved in translation (DUF1610 family)